MNPELVREVAAIEAGAHLCLLYDDDRGEQVPAVVPYIGEGLEAGEQCTYVGDTAGIQELRESLDMYGMDIASQVTGGLLRLWTPEDWHGRGTWGREASVTHMLANEAQSIGCTGARLAVDIADLIGARASADQARAWEEAVEPASSVTPVRTICLYSRSRIQAAGLLLALHAHRAVILGTSVCANQYFAAPAMHADTTDPKQAHIDWMLAQLRWAHAVEREHIGRLRAQAGLADAEAAQQRFEELYMEARRAARTREEFLASASHELKAPLTVFKGYAMLMMRQLTRGTLRVEDLAPMLDHLREYADRLERLVGDLVDSSGVQSGQLELQLESVDLATLAADVIERLAREVDPERAVDIELDAPAPVDGYWDRSRLEQLLTTLLGSALRSSPAGGKIRVSVSASGQSAEMRVHCEGAGLGTLDQSSALFEPFRHAPDAFVTDEGRGLGLYVASHIARQHGGAIEVDSSPGGGSVFTLRLPRPLSGHELPGPMGALAPPPTLGAASLPEASSDVASRPSAHGGNARGQVKGRGSH
jgi:signal transduction histidine kinase